MDAVDLPAYSFTRRTASGQGVAAGNILTGVEDNLDQPARSSARHTWLMLDGELWNVAELTRELHKAGVRMEGKGDASLALAMFELKGLDFLDSLNGNWNLLLHDEANGTTYLASDKIGSRLLFFAKDGSRFTFASEVKGVIAGREVRTRAGGSGLLQLLSSHGHIGSDTWLEGVEVLDPGTLLTFGKGGMLRRRYARLHFNEGGPQASEDDYAEGFARRLRVATERSMKDHARLPIAITLSGGLDSRSIALSIDKKHLPIPSLTFGDADSGDVRFAAELAKVVGTDHHYVEDHRAQLERESAEILDRILGPSPAGRRGFYASQLDRIAWRSEGMTNFVGLASLLWHPLYVRYMRVVLNGACGDALTGSHLAPQLLLQPSRAQVINGLRKGVLWQDPALVQRVLTPEYYRRFEPSLAPAFDRTFGEIDQDEPMAISNVWDMENRQRRGAFASFVIERYFCTVRAPYLDHELAAFLASVPPLWRFQQRVYKRMLVRQHPYARHVPWAYTEAPIHDAPLREFLREATSFGMRQLKARLPLRKDTKPIWAFRDVVKLIREDHDLGLGIDAWIASDQFPSDVFDRDGIRRFMEDFRSGQLGENAVVLHNHLCAIARAHKWWLDGGVVPIPPEADPASFGVELEQVERAASA